MWQEDKKFRWFLFSFENSVRIDWQVCTMGWGKHPLLLYGVVGGLYCMTQKGTMDQLVQNKLMFILIMLLLL